jgi:tRNA threonylcarbamoyladenosine modification (KEOPS) complex  Pcc1 subunit
LEAEIALEYSSPLLANSIMEALAPDNKMPHNAIRIMMSVSGRKLKISVTHCKRIETLQMTLQDIFRCISGAESSLKSLPER